MQTMLNKMSRIMVYGVFLLVALLLPPFAYALECVEKGTGIEIKPAIPIGQLTIPSNIAAGTKIWESEDITVTAYCYNVLGKIVDQVWFYFNPLNQSLGQGLLLGVNYNGQDLERNTARLNTHSRAIRKGENVTVTVTFRLYIKVANTHPLSGYYNGSDNFTVFQLDGSRGINKNRGAKNLRYALSGLRRVLFITCSAKLSVYPESQIVSFGSFNQTQLLTNGNNISLPFSIMAVKQGCLSNFSIQVQFFTTHPLVGNNAIDLQNGAKMTIYDDNNQAIVYNRYMYFAQLKDVIQVKKNYTARLNAIAGQPIKLGQFDVTTIIKINYD